MPSTTACRDYAAGHCPRGGSCRFSHEAGSRSGICFDFARTRSCRFGARCKFNHIPQKQAHAGKRGKGKRTGAFAKPTNEIDNFFFTYSEFDYDRSASFMEEFYRMCDFFGWERDDPDRKEAHEEFRTAMVQEFNSFYGKDIDDLSAWQKLCKTVRIYPVPDDIETCRKKIKETHVNLVDLVEQGRTGKRVRLFPNLEGLRKYTMDTGKFFPKENAYAGGILKFLLREILAA